MATYIAAVCAVQIGEVTTPDNDKCTVCERGYFSLNPANTTCDTCPHEAVCPGATVDAASAVNYTTAAVNYTTAAVSAAAAAAAAIDPVRPQLAGGLSEPLGYLVLPLDGYWHSSSLSPQLHACPNPDACTYDGRLTALHALQQAYLNASSAFSQADYLQAQCAEGYTGSLCGVCGDGYGWLSTASCTACLDNSMLYYVLVCLYSLVLLAYQIW